MCINSYFDICYLLLYLLYNYNLMRVAVKRTLKGCLSTITRHPFAAQKTTSKQGREEKGKYPLLNDNLRFDANKYQLFLVPRHP